MDFSPDKGETLIISEGYYENGTLSSENAYNNGYADGFSKVVDGLSISYTYHIHKDSDEKVYNTGAILYTTTEPGGCFKANGHTHNKTGTCTTKTTYCNATATSSNWSWDSGRHRDYRTWTCTNGHRWGEDGSDDHVSGGGGQTTTCGMPMTSYTCGNYVNTYILGCGKTEASIDSATIVYK